MTVKANAGTLMTKEIEMTQAAKCGATIKDVLKCEILVNRDALQCGREAVGFTDAKVPVCEECADDDALKIVALADPMPAHFIGTQIERSKMTNECALAFAGLRVCSECGIRVASGVLGICAECSIADHEAAPIGILEAEIGGPVAMFDGKPIPPIASEFKMVAMIRSCDHCGKAPAVAFGLCIECARASAYTDDEISSERDKKCTGPVYGNDFDAAPCDDSKCPVCPTRKVEHRQFRDQVKTFNFGEDRSMWGRLPRIPVQLTIPLAEGGLIDLIRDRAANWSRRSDKWHHKLEVSRAWSWRGNAWPALIGAAAALIVVLDALHFLKIPFAQAWPAIASVLIGLVGVRANAARNVLEAGKAADAWVSADRMFEHYRGMLAKLDALNPGPAPEAGYARLEPVGWREAVADAFAESQKLEAAARFGVPDPLRSTLDEVTS